MLRDAEGTLISLLAGDLLCHTVLDCFDDRFHTDGFSIMRGFCCGTFPRLGILSRLPHFWKLPFQAVAT